MCSRGKHFGEDSTFSFSKVLLLAVPLSAVPFSCPRTTFFLVQAFRAILVTLHYISTMYNGCWLHIYSLRQRRYSVYWPKCKEFVMNI